MTQRELAAAGGPPLSTISKIESGVHRPDAESLERYLDALGVTAHDLARALDAERGELTPAAAPTPPLPAPDVAALAALLERALATTASALEILASRLPPPPRHP